MTNIKRIKDGLLDIEKNFYPKGFPAGMSFLGDLKIVYAPEIKDTLPFPVRFRFHCEAKDDNGWIIPTTLHTHQHEDGVIINFSFGGESDEELAKNISQYRIAEDSVITLFAGKKIEPQTDPVYLYTSGIFRGAVTNTKDKDTVLLEGKKFQCDPVKRQDLDLVLVGSASPWHQPFFVEGSSGWHSYIADNEGQETGKDAATANA